MGPIYHIQKPFFATSGLFTDKISEITKCKASAENFAESLGYSNFEIDILEEYSTNLGRNFYYYDIRFLNSGPTVSILIPTKDHVEVLKTCVSSILAKTKYENYKIVIIDNDSQKSETIEYFKDLSVETRVEILKVPNKKNSGFSYSYVNNMAAKQSSSDLICFLNNDTEILSEGWLSQMVGVARNPQVGCAGALLMYPNSWVQHSGINFGMMYNKLPVPAFKGLENRNDAYFGSLFSMQNYMAVSAACMMVKKSDFLELGGFDEIDFGVAYNDCDFGIRLYQTGKRNVFCPGAVVTHFEGYTRGTGIGNDNPSEEAAFLRKYGSLIDPYYNRTLTVDSQNCTIARVSRYPISKKKPLKGIVAFTHNLNFEGAPLVLFELLQSLSKKMTNAITVISPADGLLTQKYRENGIRVIIDASVGIGARHNESSLNELISRCQSYFADASLVLANTVLGFQFILAAEKIGIPGIWIIHESEPPFTHLNEHGGVAEYFAKITARSATQVVFVSEATRDYYKYTLGLTDNTSVIYNAIDLDRLAVERARYTKSEARKILGIHPNSIIGLCVGSVCARKRQQDLVEIMARVQDETAERLEIIIVGDREGAYSSELHRKVGELGARSSRIHIIKETPDPFPYFIASDFFLFCSGLESYPRVLQEALYFDLPAITTNVFGNKEIISSKKNGLFFDVGDLDQAALHVDKVCKDKNSFESLVANCAPGVKRFSDIKKFTNAYTDLIHAAVEI
jgi:GT2 family glycosyltransferase/glycosyltransferase involved in cell wall biosynthesis